MELHSGVVISYPSNEHSMFTEMEGRWFVVFALDDDWFALALLEFRLNATDPDCFFCSLACRDVFRLFTGSSYAAIAVTLPCYGLP